MAREFLTKTGRQVLGEGIDFINPGFEEPKDAMDAEMAADVALEHAQVSDAVFGRNGGNGADEIKQQFVSDIPLDPAMAEREFFRTGRGQRLLRRDKGERERERESKKRSLEEVLRDRLKQEMVNVVSGGAGQFTAGGKMQDIVVKAAKAIDSITGGSESIEQKVMGGAESLFDLKESIKSMGDKLADANFDIFDLVKVGGEQLKKFVSEEHARSAEEVLGVGKMVMAGQAVASNEAREALEAIKEGTSLAGDSFDKLKTIQTGLNMITAKIPETESIIGGVVGKLTNVFRDEMQQSGVSDDIINQFIEHIDTNGDKVVDAAELTMATQNENMMKLLTTIDATTAKMIKNPAFRTQIIERQTRPSIYGADFLAKFNQVGLVQHGFALDREDANLFNVGFQ